MCNAGAREGGQPGGHPFQPNVMSPLASDPTFDRMPPAGSSNLIVSIAGAHKVARLEVTGLPFDHADSSAALHPAARGSGFGSGLPLAARRSDASSSSSGSAAAVAAATTAAAAHPAAEPGRQAERRRGGRRVAAAFESLDALDAALQQVKVRPCSLGSEQCVNTCVVDIQLSYDQLAAALASPQALHCSR